MKVIDELEKKALSDIKNSDSLEKLKELKNNYFGKKGKLAELFQSVSAYSKEEKADFGKKANNLKQKLEKIFYEKEINLKTEKNKESEKLFDPTIPGEIPIYGSVHPITLTLNRLIEIFESIGFSAVYGPEIETVWYNFDALNFPEEHPAREMQDTLFVKTNDKKKPKVMRTHTSPVQIRYMESNQPPLKIIVPGRVYRNEATDASHEINFYQLEGLMIDKNISVANFKAVITDFINHFFETDVKVRLRPSFFPFTEPSFEVDMGCSYCNQKGCSACSQTGWIEVLGAGMVHPNVIKNSGLNPADWQGFAFGMGVERLSMIKHKISDIRLFYQNDIRFLKQFK